MAPNSLPEEDAKAEHARMTRIYRVLGAMRVLRQFRIHDLAIFSGMGDDEASAIVQRSWHLLRRVPPDLAPNLGEHFEVREECWQALQNELEQAFEELRRLAVFGRSVFHPDPPDSMKLAESAIDDLLVAKTAAECTTAFDETILQLSAAFPELERLEVRGGDPFVIRRYRQCLASVEDSIRRAAEIVEERRLSNAREDYDLIFWLNQAKKQLSRPESAFPALLPPTWEEETVTEYLYNESDGFVLPEGRDRATYYGNKRQIIMPPPYHKARRQTELQKRVLPVSTTVCLELESSVTDLCQEVVGTTRTDCKVIVLSGSPGVGKSTLARAVISRATTEYGYSPIDICFFDCRGLTSFEELYMLLLTQIQHSTHISVPERWVDRKRVLEAHFASESSAHRRRLWVLDDFDDLLHPFSTSQGRGSSPLISCLDIGANLRILVTCRRELTTDESCMIFGEQRIHSRSLSISDYSLLELPSEGSVGDPNVARHPLANRLVHAAGLRLTPIDWFEAVEQPWNDFNLLQYACEHAWHALSSEERMVLKVCVELPAGLWINDEDCRLLIPWDGIFKIAKWRDVLLRLRRLEWIVKKEDRVDGYTGAFIYYLRPALRQFVEGREFQNEHGDVVPRLVWFWGRQLRQWGRILAVRSIDKVEIRTASNSVDEPSVLAEEDARFLIDITRLNWMHSFRNAVKLRVSGNVFSLLTIYLRGFVCYFRMSGNHTLFKQLVSEALDVLTSIANKGAGISPWLRAFQTVCLASCLGMKGRSHRRLGEWNESVKCLSAAVEILERVSYSFRRVRREMAWVLTELGRVNHYLGRWDEASSQLTKAINIRQSLSEEQRCSGHLDVSPGLSRSMVNETAKGVDERYLASSLNLYGNLLNEGFRPYEAEMFHRRALAIRVNLMRRNPLYFSRYVANCLNDLGSSLFYQGKLDEALSLYQRALAIRESLVQNENSALGQYVARTCNNIGNTLRRKGFWQEAEPFLVRAIGIYRAAVNEVAGRFEGLIASTLSNLGRVYYHQGLTYEALQVLQEAERYHLSASEARGISFDSIESANFLALVYTEYGADDMALSTLSSAETLLENSASQSQQSYLFFRAFTLNTKARIILNLGSDFMIEAEGLVRESLELRQRMAKSMVDASILELHFAQGWHDLGHILRLKGLPEAEEYLNRSLVIRRKVAAEFPRYAFRLVARSCLELGHFEKARGNRDEASVLYGQAVDIFMELHLINPCGFGGELERARECFKSCEILSPSNGVGSLQDDA